MTRAPVAAIVDFCAGLAMVALLVGVSLAYLVRVVRLGRSRHTRCDADGGSALLGKPVMEMGYWLFAPIARTLARFGARPDRVTMLAMVPGIAAAVAAAQGLFGLACLLGTAAALCDLLDGLIARELATDSSSGAFLDTTVDRYVEWSLLAGLAIHFRGHLVLLVATLLATLGSFMVSYTSLASQAYGVAIPRGLMRRSERAVFLLLGCGLSSLSPAWLASATSPSWVREWPVVVAVVLVAVIANLSAIYRLTVGLRSLNARSKVAPRHRPVARGERGDTLPAGLATRLRPAVAASRPVLGEGEEAKATSALSGR